jgi:hypothetical protein
MNKLIVPAVIVYQRSKFRRLVAGGITGSD